MNMHESFAPPKDIGPIAQAPVPAARLLWVCTRLCALVKYMADSWAAAAAYEDLSRLSDTVLPAA
jgi:hypothetical protein